MIWYQTVTESETDTVWLMSDVGTLSTVPADVDSYLSRVTDSASHPSL